jgi:5-hydroxyisourate hydrolase-like protein (transthyretin family)
LAIEPIDHKEAEWRIAYATEAPSETTDVTKVGMYPLNFSKGHYYGNGGLTSAVPLLLTPTFVLKLAPQKH